MPQLKSYLRLRKQGTGLTMACRGTSLFASRTLHLCCSDGSLYLFLKLCNMHAAQMCPFHGVLKFMANGEAVVSLVMELRWRLLHSMPVRQHWNPVLVM
jgi:hypothetical protein